MELRDTRNVLINGSTMIGFVFLLCTCKCSTQANADVGGLMMDYHLDHNRLERHIEDIIHGWYEEGYKGGSNEGSDRSGSSDGPGTTGPADRDP